MKAHPFLRRISLASTLALCGCATILQGKFQDISIASAPPGAQCILKRNGQKIGAVLQTPGIVTIKKTKDDILLTCNLSGYQQATQFIHSGVASGTYGNIILGGPIGWGVDSAAGADNEYAKAVNVTFVPKQPRSSN